MVYVDGQPVPCVVGTSLLNALINAGCVVPSACGGTGVCHLCRVRLAPDAEVSAPDAQEARALGRTALLRGERLSCRVVVVSPLHVTLMPLPTSEGRRP